MKRTDIRCWLILITAFWAGSCGNTAGNVSNEISKLRDHRNQLCNNPIVHSFRSLITNRDAIAGEETLTCFIEGKPIPFDRSYEEENRLKTEAESYFFSICKNSLTQKAKILLKGRQIGIIRRNCVK